MTGVDVRISEVQHQRVVRGVLLALSRFGPRIRTVTVRLAEPANPLGGVDLRCRMRARLQDGSDVHAEALNGGIDTAVARTAAQLAKRVGSALDGLENDGSIPAPRRPRRRARAR